MIVTRGLGRPGGLLPTGGLGHLTPIQAATGIAILLAEIADVRAAGLGERSYEAVEVRQRAAAFAELVRHSAELWDVPAELWGVDTPTAVGGYRLSVPIRTETFGNRVLSDAGHNLSDHDGQPLTVYLRLNRHHIQPAGGGANGWAAPQNDDYPAGSTNGGPLITHQEDTGHLAFSMYNSALGLIRIETGAGLDTYGLGDQLVWFRCQMSQDGTTIAAIDYSTEQEDHWSDVLGWTGTSATNIGATGGTGWRSVTSSSGLFHRMNFAATSDGSGDIAFYELWAGATRLHRLDARDIDEADVVDAGTHVDSLTGETWTFDIAAGGLTLEVPVLVPGLAPLHVSLESIESELEALGLLVSLAIGRAGELAPRKWSASLIDHPGSTELDRDRSS